MLCAKIYIYMHNIDIQTCIMQTCAKFTTYLWRLNIPSPHQPCPHHLR